MFLFHLLIILSVFLPFYVITIASSLLNKLKIIPHDFTELYSKKYLPKTFEFQIYKREDRSLLFMIAKSNII